MYPADIRGGKLPDGYKLVVIRPPIDHPEDGDIGSVQALYSEKVLNGQELPALTVKMCMTQKEFETIQDGGAVWLTFVGAMPIFSMDVGFGPVEIEG